MTYYYVTMHQWIVHLIDVGRNRHAADAEHPQWQRPHIILVYVPPHDSTHLENVHLRGHGGGNRGQSSSCLVLVIFALKWPYNTLSEASDGAWGRRFLVGNSVGLCLGVLNPVCQPLWGRERPRNHMVPPSTIWYFCPIEYPQRARGLLGLALTTTPAGQIVLDSPCINPKIWEGYYLNSTAVFFLRHNYS